MFERIGGMLGAAFYAVQAVAVGGGHAISLQGVGRMGSRGERKCNMAMRLRRIGGSWKALCAAGTEALPGDLYLDDAQDRAIRQKIEADWNSEGCGPADVDRLRKKKDDRV